MRPGMYIGNTDDGSGMHQLLWEVVGNAIDEHLRSGLRGYVRIRAAGHHVTVEDNGRGMPLELFEPAMTSLSDPRPAHPHVHLGPNLLGLGIGVVCALSDNLELDVRRDGRAYHQSFARGCVAGPLLDRGPDDRTGTCVGFTPDFTRMAPRPWDLDAITTRARELAALVPGLTFIVEDEAYCYPDGLVDHLAHLTRDRALVAPFHVRDTRDGIRVEAALTWIDADAMDVQAFVNGSRCLGGTHLDGFLAGAQRALTRRLGRAKGRAAGIRRGLVGIVHALLADPRWGNPTKDWLVNPEVEVIVAAVVEDGLAGAAGSDPTFDAILARLA